MRVLVTACFFPRDRLSEVWTVHLSECFQGPGWVAAGFEVFRQGCQQLARRLLSWYADNSRKEGFVSRH